MHGANQAIGSNIGCSLASTIAASSIRDKASRNTLQLAVNAFHGHAHNHRCQLENHPLYRRGFGLEDLETCKRIFAGSNATAPLIRHASHFHYVQYLDLHFNQWDMDRYLELSKYNVCAFWCEISPILGRFLFNNYKQAFSLITDYSKDLDAYRALYPTQTLNFEAWASEELEYLKNVATEPMQDTLAIKYVEALELLWKYRLVKVWFNFTVVWHDCSLGKPTRGSNRTCLFHTTQHRSHRILVWTMRHLKQQSKDTQSGALQSANYKTTQTLLKSWRQALALKRGGHLGAPNTKKYLNMLGDTNSSAQLRTLKVSWCNSCSSSWKQISRRRVSFSVS